MIWLIQSRYGEERGSNMKHSYKVTFQEFQKENFTNYSEEHWTNCEDTPGAVWVGSREGVGIIVVEPVARAICP